MSSSSPGIEIIVSRSGGGMLCPIATFIPPRQREHVSFACSGVSDRIGSLARSSAALSFTAAAPSVHARVKDSFHGFGGAPCAGGPSRCSGAATMPSYTMAPSKGSSVR